MRAIRLLIFAMLFWPGLCVADVSDTQKSEVRHLITYAKDSVCQMDRNGTWHSSKEAAEHIEKKYHYFRNDIHSTEDFIRLSATQSTWSGKYYRVRCDGEEIETSSQWLLRELKRYRQTRETPSP
jgi:hypothetical protein